MIRRLLFVLCIVTLAFGCKKEKKTDHTEEPVTVDDVAALTSVKVEAKYNSGKIAADVECTINEKDEIIAIIPERQTTKQLALSFATKSEGTTVKAGDVLQVSGFTVTDYSKPVTYTLRTPRGKIRTYKVIIKNFTGLPILYLTTAAPVNSKETYVKGSVTVDPNQEFEQEQLTIPMQIKGRGNSTWVLFPKKPYRLKFDSKAAMLGMPAAKNWVLLANYSDKTLIRTKIALELGRRIGSDWTPQSRFVEVVMNGEYVGNYLLTSQVEVNENRVNITELKKTNTSADEIKGGYLLEIDQKLDADYWFKTKKNLPFTIKSPEDITPEQLSYIKGYMQEFEDVLFSSNYDDPTNGWAKYINPESFINWWFVQELVKNQDARDYSSIFYYKDRNGKLGMGPLWDFDTSSGNIENSVCNIPQNYYIRDATYFLRLFQDVKFRIVVRKRWDEIKQKEQIKQIFADIDQYAAYLQLSQKENFKRWPILNSYVWPNAVVTGSYDAEVAYLKTFLTQRYAWMEQEMSLY